MKMIDVDNDANARINCSSSFILIINYIFYICLLSTNNIRSHWQEVTTLIVADREIRISSAALATSSDVFKAMITSDFQEGKTGRIVMPGKSYDAVEFMMQYITSTDYVPIQGVLTDTHGTRVAPRKPLYLYT